MWHHHQWVTLCCRKLALKSNFTNNANSILHRSVFSRFHFFNLNKIEMKKNGKSFIKLQFLPIDDLIIEYFDFWSPLICFRRKFSITLFYIFDQTRRSTHSIYVMRSLPVKNGQKMKLYESVTCQKFSDQRYFARDSENCVIPVTT